MFKFDFKLTSGDKNVGTVYLPNKNSRNIPVIIYCHGWNGNRYLSDYPTMLPICERAMQENIAIVAFDFFGFGETGGDHSKMTYTRWKENLAEIVSWVISQPFSKDDKIGCFAVSSGTTAALRLAAEDSRLAFIISVATCATAHFNMHTGGPAKLLADNLVSLVADGTANILNVDFGIDFFIDTISKAPIHTVKQIQCPVLFLQGTADNTFRCADAKMAYDLMVEHNPRASYISVEGGNHGIDNMPEIAAEKAFEWLLGGL